MKKEKYIVIDRWWDYEPVIYHFSTKKRAIAKAKELNKRIPSSQAYAAEIFYHYPKGLE